MNYQTYSQPSRHPAQRSGGDAINTLGDLFATPFVWLTRVQDRRRLAELDDHMLQDIGLSRSQAEEVAATPFWRR